MSVRILIADDHELVRRGLISVILSKHPEWEIVGEAATGATAIALGDALQPTAAILDLSMPDGNGIEVAAHLIAHVRGIRIVILTMHLADPILRLLRKTGVHAYLAKNEAPARLVEVLESVIAGSPFIASRPAQTPAVEPPEYIPAPFLLTARELEVMRLLAMGSSNKEIAARLDMSVRTVETHHANILRKLEIESIGELARIAVRDHVI